MPELVLNLTEQDVTQYLNLTQNDDGTLCLVFLENDPELLSMFAKQKWPVPTKPVAYYIDNPTPDTSIGVFCNLSRKTSFKDVRKHVKAEKNVTQVKCRMGIAERRDASKKLIGAWAFLRRSSDITIK